MELPVDWRPCPLIRVRLSASVVVCMPAVPLLASSAGMLALQSTARVWVLAMAPLQCRTDAMQGELHKQEFLLSLMLDLTE